MSRTKEAISETGTFKALCRVNTSIVLNRYPSFKKYSQKFLEQLRADNGDHLRLPPDFGYKIISRGQVLTFGDETVVDPETGVIEVFHKEIFEDLSKRFAELPCGMPGEVKANFRKAVSYMPEHIKKQMIMNEEKETARFKIEPILEKYTGQELEG